MLSERNQATLREGQSPVRSASLRRQDPALLETQVCGALHILVQLTNFLDGHRELALPPIGDVRRRLR